MTHSSGMCDYETFFLAVLWAQHLLPAVIGLLFPSIYTIILFSLYFSG